ncbi:MAG: hypothetical protein Ct9H90mP28_4280 [Paracoccaceae bacterium]|nr:MAG: hypothetical protein Ct9H90mP28_4280 [Paracoccaceae bacterium]
MEKLIKPPTHQDNIDSDLNVLEYKTNDADEIWTTVIKNDWNKDIRFQFYGEKGTDSSGVERIITWKVTDATGSNSTEKEQKFNVIDKYGPNFLDLTDNANVVLPSIDAILPADSPTMNVDISVPWVNDNVDGLLEVVGYELYRNGSPHSENENVATNKDSSGNLVRDLRTHTINNLETGEYIIEWYASDSAGNKNENNCTTELNVKDETPPKITWTGNYSPNPATRLNDNMNLDEDGKIKKTVRVTVEAPSDVVDTGSGLKSKNTFKCVFEHDGVELDIVWSNIFNECKFDARFGTTKITWIIEDNATRPNTAESSIEVYCDFGWVTESRVDSDVQDAPSLYNSSLYKLFDKSGSSTKKFPNRSYGSSITDNKSPMFPHANCPLSYVRDGAWRTNNLGHLTLRGEWIQFNKFNENLWWDDYDSKSHYGKNIRLWTAPYPNRNAPHFPYTVAVIGSNSDDFSSTTESILLTRITGMIWYDYGSVTSFGKYYSPSINLGSSKEYDYYRIVFEKIHGGSSDDSYKTVQISYVEYVAGDDSDYITASGIYSDTNMPENIVKNDNSFWATKGFDSSDTFPQECPYTSAGGISTSNNAEYAYVSYVGPRSFRGHWLQINTSSNHKSFQNGSIEDVDWKNFGFKCVDGYIFKKIVVIGSNVNNIGKWNNDLTEANNIVYSTENYFENYFGDEYRDESSKFDFTNNIPTRVLPIIDLVNVEQKTGYTFYRFVFEELNDTSEIKIKNLAFIPSTVPNIIFGGDNGDQSNNNSKRIINIASSEQGWTRSGTYEVVPPFVEDPSGFFENVVKLYYSILPESTDNPSGFVFGGGGDRVSLNVNDSKNQYKIIWEANNLVNTVQELTTVNITWAELDKENWGWLKGSYSSVKERYEGTNSGVTAYNESGKNFSPYHHLDAAGLNGILYYPVVYGPINFTIGVIIYNFDINIFDDNGPDGDGRHLIDISNHEDVKYKFGHSLRLKLVNDEEINGAYATLDTWWQYNLRTNHPFKIACTNTNFNSGYDWKVIYVSKVEEANTVKTCVQVSYRIHGSNNSWTSFGANDITGGGDNFTTNESAAWSTGSTLGGVGTGSTVYSTNRPAATSDDQRLQNHNGLVIGGTAPSLSLSGREMNHEVSSIIIREALDMQTD